METEQTIRVYFELKNMAEVRAILAFAESMDLALRMAPLARQQRYNKHGPHGNTPADALPIEKTDKFKLGPPVNLPADSDAKERFPIIARILGSKAMEYQQLCRQFARTARVDKRRAGFTVSFLIRMGALVRAEE